jgi:hypothetical protein
MLCNKLCCDITIRLVTINFRSCIPYYVTSCILTFVKVHNLATYWHGKYVDPILFRSKEKKDALHCIQSVKLLVYNSVFIYHI